MSLDMTTLIRVKRRLGEEPLETILVRPKRRRVEGDGGEEATALPLPTVLERVATLDSKDTSIELSALREYKKSWELRQSYKKLGPSEGWREAGRRQAKERGRESRYLITASHRVSTTTTTTDLDRQDNSLGKTAAEDKGCSTDATDKIRFCDAQISSLHAEEDVITCNGQPMQSEKYVYDIYYHPDSMDWAEFVCEQPKLMIEEEEEEEGEEDEDDENAENNWRNEYPEEDEENEDEYRDEDSYWGRPLRGRALLKHESDESFDADEYDEDEDSDECSFDEYGNLITSSVSHLGNRLALTVLSSGDESEGEGERERL